MKHILILILFFLGSQARGQELWQLSPWATDSTYVLGALSSGEPTWVQINGVATRIDSMTYANDTLYVYTPDTTLKAEIVGGSGLPGSAATNRVAFGQSTDTLTYDSLFYFNPTNNFLGVGTGSPNGAGALGGIHVNSNFFTGVHLTNNQTGTTASDGTEFYIYGDTLYIANKENGKIELATNGASRMTITGAGRVGVNTANPSTTLHVTGETTISSLASGGSAPATSGTTVKVISDANGKLSFQTNNTGTVTSVGLTTGTTGTDVSVSGSPITGSGTITLNIPTASGTNTGKLSSTDWSTFNSKLGSLNGLTASTQTFAVSTASAGFGITSSISTHTFNLPYEESSFGLRLGLNAKVVGNSTMVGYDAGANLTGGNNVGIGKGAVKGGVGSTGTNNVGLGFETLLRITSGVNNVAAGSYALSNLTIGSYNFGLGEQSLLSNITGSDNVAIGRWSSRLTTGSGTVAIGTYSFRSATGSLNVGIGYGTGEYNTGQYNTYIGTSAGGSSGAASSCVALGYAAGQNNTNSDRLHIDNTSTATPLIGGNFSTNAVGINTSVESIARTLHVTGEARITDLTTDTPTGVVGADADGDLGTVSTGNGVTLSSGALGLTGQALAVHNLGTNGLIARTGAGTVAARTITAGDGISITDGDGVSGNPTVTAVREWGNMSNQNTSYTLSTVYTKILLNATGSDEGDGAYIQTDAVEDEIEILQTADYHIELKANCKSNTASHTVTWDVQSITGTSMSCITNHYYDNTNEYSHNNMHWVRSVTAGTSLGLYAKTSSGTPNVNDCAVRIFVKKM